jgi:hypothetical protein
MRYGKYKVIKREDNDSRNWSELYDNSGQPVKKISMNEQEQIEDRLWNYIDGLSDTTEKSAIEQLIAANIEWRKKYRELLEVHQLMNDSPLDAPSLRFTRNVMEAIAQYQVAPATKNYINKRVIWGIGIFFLVMITGFLIYGFSQVNWNSGTGSSEILDQYNKLPKLDWNKFMTNTYTNIFMMINVVLGLILFDMYLQRKKEMRAKNLEPKN